MDANPAIDFRMVAARLKASAETSGLGFALEEFQRIRERDLRALASTEDRQAQYASEHWAVGAELSRALSIAGERQMALGILERCFTHVNERLEREGLFPEVKDCSDAIILGAVAVGDRGLLERVLQFAEHIGALWKALPEEPPELMSDFRERLFSMAENADELEIDGDPFPYETDERGYLAILQLIEQENFEAAHRLLHGWLDLSHRADCLWQILRVVEVDRDPRLAEFLLKESRETLISLENALIADFEDDDAELWYENLAKGCAVFQAKCGLRSDAFETLGAASGLVDPSLAILAWKILIYRSLPAEKIEDGDRSEAIYEVLEQVRRKLHEADDQAVEMLERFALELSPYGDLASQEVKFVLSLMDQSRLSDMFVVRMANAMLLSDDLEFRESIIAEALRRFRVAIASDLDGKSSEGINKFNQLIDGFWTCDLLYRAGKSATNIAEPLLRVIETAPQLSDRGGVLRRFSQSALSLDLFELAMRAKEMESKAVEAPESVGLSDGNWQFQKADCLMRDGRVGDAVLCLNEALEALRQRAFLLSVNDDLEKLGSRLPRPSGARKYTVPNDPSAQLDELLVPVLALTFRGQAENVRDQCMQLYKKRTEKGSRIDGFKLQNQLIAEISHDIFYANLTPKERAIWSREYAE